MSKVLCTFPGKYGDILWSLATVRQIAINERCSVDMVTMPQYRSLLPLLSFQSYIDKAFVVENWECTGSPFGDQPCVPPKDVENGYEKCFHLGYTFHPFTYLIDFIAVQQKVELPGNPIPFIGAPRNHVLTDDPRNYIAWSFNASDADMKAKFMQALREHMKRLGVKFVDVSTMAWMDAAVAIRDAMCFVGCRSSNNVIAHGVGQKNIFIYETVRNRHPHCPLGNWSGNPYHKEEAALISSSPEEAAWLAATIIRIWHEQKQEVVCA